MRLSLILIGVDQVAGRGGGIFIYIKDSIRYKLRSDVPVDDLEVICIEVEPPKSKKQTVSCSCLVQAT